MGSPSRQAVAVTLGALGFLATDFFVTTVRVPLFWYLPLERQFAFGVLGTGAAMDFYGRLLWSVIGGLAVGAIGAWRLPVLDEPAVRRWELRAIAWLGLLLVLTTALHVTQLVGRHPVPLDLLP